MSTVNVKRVAPASRRKKPSFFMLLFFVVLIAFVVACSLATMLVTGGESQGARVTPSMNCWVEDLDVQPDTVVFSEPMTIYDPSITLQAKVCAV
jgi:hypothetical protein